MPEEPRSPGELGRYLALAAAGVEMVVPIIVGVYLDGLLGWRPWLTVAGIVLGLSVSLVHLVVLAKRFDEPRQRDEP